MNKEVKRNNNTNTSLINILTSPLGIIVILGMIFLVMLFSHILGFVLFGILLLLACMGGANIGGKKVENVQLLNQHLKNK
jgi:hypothetical protein